MTAPTAVLLCEGRFASADGKTTHGLVRYSAHYRVLAVLDSTLAGRDAGEALDGKPKGIPILAGLDAAFERFGRFDVLIVGVATDGGRLPSDFRPILLDALGRGVGVAAGLHEKLREDPELVAAAAARGVPLLDVRTTPPRESLHFWSGKIRDVKCPKIAVLGTDSAIGKRTTARILVEGLKARGYKAVFIGTGQTGRLQGAKHSIILDSLVNDFVTGEIEHVVWTAWNEESPDLIVLEGQGSITHPAYPGGFEIVAGARVDSIVLQHAPGRVHLDGFPEYPMPDPAREIAILELLSEKRVVAVTLNHENLDAAALAREAEALRARFGRTVTDPLRDGPDALVDAILLHHGLPRAKRRAVPA